MYLWCSGKSHNRTLTLERCRGFKPIATTYWFLLKPNDGEHTTGEEQALPREPDLANSVIF